MNGPSIGTVSRRYTAAPGEDHHNASLTEAKVKRMRRLREEKGVEYRVLAEQFGITWQHAWRICARRAWKHVA